MHQPQQREAYLFAVSTSGSFSLHPSEREAHRFLAERARPADAVMRGAIAEGLRSRGALYTQAAQLVRAAVGRFDIHPTEIPVDCLSFYPAIEVGQ